MRITLSQQPALAGALTRNQDLLSDQIGKAVTDNTDVLLTGAHPLTGDAADLHTDPGFAHDLHTATTETLGAAEQQGLRSSFEPNLDTLITKDGVKVVFATVTDSTTLTQVANAAAATGATLLAISAALPFTQSGPEKRLGELIAASKRLRLAIAFVNRVGGADRSVYDGGSVFLDANGRIIYRAPLFDAATATIDLDTAGEAVTGAVSSHWPQTIEAQVYAALVTGTRDYVHNNGFTSVILGLSGGIDSALVAAITVDALGPNHVHGIGMPGPYSSEGSVADARTLATNLGIRFDVVPITAAYTAEVTTLGILQEGPGEQVAQENMQARIRSLHLMTIANASNSLVLNTCNKSEDAVGYATYGGDALGAYAPLADVPKTLAYRLAEWRNTHGVEVIPTDTITKPPSAELSPGQQDTDTLPPYDILDTIIERYLTDRDTPDRIIAVITERFRLDPAQARVHVAWVLKMIDQTEWKRQQGPLGPQITAAPFASRQVPVTNGRVHRLS